MTLYYKYIQTTMKNDEKNSDKIGKCKKIRKENTLQVVHMVKCMKKKVIL